jgi:RNA polymerase sigma-70 factor (ECF subfamily)
MECEVAALYASHAPSLLRYASTLVGDSNGGQDAIQEIFLRYFVARTEGRQFDNPKAWLFRVLRNHVLDALKSSSAKNEIAIEGIDNSSDRNDPELHYHRAEMVRVISNLLAPREFECVRLRAEGLRYEEIAEILDLRLGTVGATLARAHKKVRRVMGRDDDVKDTPIASARAAAREENSYSS